MAANLNKNESVDLTTFINSDVVRELFAFGLGGVLGLIAWGIDLSRGIVGILEFMVRGVLLAWRVWFEECVRYNGGMD
ncbi:predicted protein [Sclerotinia sclerotiorum 1980 UF-70]|uniref:Uncharacterized protein n=1 Tax=Sclerotinia sclerotiorum (strain ATCC 18683 / 1980 / Ss-1) TaxID=665079 RepID=A7F4R4_SCLS1|nr:predicted protein [Sclerotinia sclerotiorum 1980 UF-70]EDN97735.1 predicted protein [Sclerotinia sclerotiorum 1980 UF-70]